MAFAKGKYSYGLCDYCGQRYPYNVLQKNWRGFKVCPEDYEPKEPQLEPLKFSGDAIALYEPRPDRVEPVTVYVGSPGDSAFQSLGSANGGTNMQPYPEQGDVFGVGGVGTVTVVASATVSHSGVSATGQIGTVSASGNSVIISFSGSAFGSGNIGNVVIPNVSFGVSGVEGSGEINGPSVTT